MKRIIEKFNIEGNLLSFERYGEGHINETYLLNYENNGELNQYILQKINHNIFPNI